jgi:uncharacterized protein with NRDE domain
MCLLVVGWNAHPDFRLVIAGNRDEFHERPAAPLGWWKDVSPPVLAGRDLKASGTWLGLARDGRFGIVTNFRDFDPPPAGGPTRGELVPSYLRGEERAAQYLAGLERRAREYGGFNLLLGDRDSLHYFSNRGDTPPRSLPAGICGLSNQWLDTPWPKLTRTRERFAALMSGGGLAAEELFALLADRTTTGDADLPHTGLPEDWERAVSAPFVVNERYGTRCSTVVFVDRVGRTVVHERRFDPGGVQSGASRFAFAIGPTASAATAVSRERAGATARAAARDASPE